MPAGWNILLCLQGRRKELFVVTKIWNDEHRPDVARFAAIRKEGRERRPYNRVPFWHRASPSRSACSRVVANPTHRQSVKKSLEDLGLEYADLVLVHWPHAWKPGTQEEDSSVTLEETWCAAEGEDEELETSV